MKKILCVIKVTSLIQCTCRRNFWYNYKYKIASISTSIQLLKYSGTLQKLMCQFNPFKVKLTTKALVKLIEEWLK